MPNGHDCVHEEDFRRLEGLIVQVFAKMDAFLTDLRQIAVGDARFQERVDTLRRDVDTLFKRTRLVDERVDSLAEWKNELKGSIKVWVAVPSLLASVLAALKIFELLTK